MSPNGQFVKVWDPFIRIFHWTLVTAFVVAYLTEDDLLGLHVWAGYIIIGLLFFRLVWGLVGTRHARFTDFIYSPTSIRAFLKNTLRLKAPRYLGHNPAGGLMVIVLLVMLVLISASGLVLYAVDEHAGPLASLLSGVGENWEGILEGLHEFLVNSTVALVVVHIAGVVVESLVHRENLVQAMVTGLKRK